MPSLVSKDSVHPLLQRGAAAAATAAAAKGVLDNAGEVAGASVLRFPHQQRRCMRIGGSEQEVLRRRQTIPKRRSKRL